MPEFWRSGCLSDGELSVLVNNADAAPPSVRDHLVSCSHCARRLDAAQADHAFATTALARIATEELPAGYEDASFDTMRRQLSIRELPRSATWSEGTNVSDLWNRRGLRAAATGVVMLIVALALTLSPMRTLANDFLLQFRVQKFAAITIPMDAVEPFQAGIMSRLSEEERERLESELNELGVFESTFSLDMDHMPAPVTLDEARALYGEFDEPDELPDSFDAAPNAYVTEAGSASYVLDVDRANAMIDALNLPIYELDTVAADTLTFAVNVPSAIVLEYTNASGETIIVGQAESPELTIPDDIDMNALREEVLRFPGLPADLVAQLRSIDNWEETLIVPIPSGATSDDITINGEPGLLIEHSLGSAVLWEKNGKLFAVVGQASADEIRALADSMQ